MIRHRSITVTNRMNVDHQKKVAEKLLGLTYGEMFEEMGKLHPVEILLAIQNLLAVTTGPHSSARVQYSAEIEGIFLEFCEGKTSFQDLKDESESALNSYIAFFDDCGGDFEKICYKKEAIFEQVIV